MRVNAVNSAVHFDSKVKTQKRSVSTAPSYESIDDKKLFKSSLALTAIGLTSIGIYMVARKGWRPLDTLKSMKKSFKNQIHSQKRKKDPVIKLLNGERDAKAVQKYKEYTAQKKMNSLTTKIANGEFKDAPTSVINNLRTNAIKLAKITGNISQYVPN